MDVAKNEPAFPCETRYQGHPGLTEALEDAGYDPEPYSGRAMFGAQCVSVELEGDGDLWELAVDLARTFEGRIPAPRTDSMGKGIVAYWPSAKMTEAA